MFRSDIVVQECVDVKQHCLSFARWPCCYCCHSENDCGNRFSLNFIIFTGSLITSAQSDKPSQTHWLEMQFSTLKFFDIKLLVKIMKFNELIPSQISQNLTTVVSLCNTLVTIPVQSSYDQLAIILTVTKNMAIWQWITNVARQYHF